MAKAKKKIDLVAECMALPPKRVNWLTRVTPEQMKALEQVRAAYQAGKVAASVDAIRTRIGLRLGFTIDKHAFARWLSDGRPIEGI